MFKIKKHYFDGIDKNGNAIIIYAAEMSFLGLKIPYSSYITSDSKGIFEKAFLKKGQLINQSKLTFLLNDSSQIFGNWEKIDEGFSENLHEINGKILIWNCHHPKANFEVRCEEFFFSGLGYAETLELNFAPWKLPISELKWGRFLSENNTIVWIEWLGKKPLKKVYWNGKLQENAEITELGITFENQEAKLIFENPQIIKDEPLLKIANRFPFLKIFFSKQFLQTQETKYKSKSIFLHHNEKELGWSLYETVLWKSSN